MLSVVGKVLAHIILARMSPVIDGKISECQADFHKARGCADQIFKLRRVMEQARDKKCHSHYALSSLRLRTIRSIEADCGEYCGDIMETPRTLEISQNFISIKLKDGVNQSIFAL